MAQNSGSTTEDATENVTHGRGQQALHPRETAPMPTSEQEPESVESITCIACASELPPNTAATMPCSHDYCTGCLETLYMRCTTNETLFPPRCCDMEFSWDAVKPLLSQSCVIKFTQRRTELETKDRTYCYLPTCSTFIDPATYWGDNIATCVNYSQHSDTQFNTCIKCKNRSHDGDCPRDEAMDALRTLAEENRWQTCYGCKRVIEREEGCDYMVCICKSAFCYSCGKPAHECRCGQSDEEEEDLYDRAVALVENGQAPRASQRMTRQQQIDEAVDHLREQDDCNHEKFRHVRQGGHDYECEMCNNTYHNWINQCRHCWMIICNGCRHRSSSGR